MNKLAKVFLALFFALALNANIIFVSLAYDSPLVVVITASWCSSCQKVKPVIEELEYEYYGRIKFVTLDATSKYTLEEAKQLAEENNIIGFFNERKGSLPAVGIVCPGGTKVDKVFVGELRKEIYKEALDVLLFDAPRICSL